ncbi:hypothetical protein LguiA_028154 [Lonicera macranthoides]
MELESSAHKLIRSQSSSGCGRSIWRSIFEQQISEFEGQSFFIEFQASLHGQPLCQKRYKRMSDCYQFCQYCRTSLNSIKCIPTLFNVPKSMEK